MEIEDKEWFLIRKHKGRCVIELLLKWATPWNLFPGSRCTRFYVSKRVCLLNGACSWSHQYGPHLDKSGEVVQQQQCVCVCVCVCMCVFDSELCQAPHQSLGHRTRSLKPLIGSHCHSPSETCRKIKTIEYENCKCWQDLDNGHQTLPFAVENTEVQIMYFWPEWWCP